MYKYLIIILFATNMFSQQKLLIKTWESSINYKNKNIKTVIVEKITFFSNNNFSQSDGQNIVEGKWKYNQKNKTITMVGNNVPLKIVLKVIKLTTTELVFESKGIDKNKKIVYMKPSK